MELSHIIDLLKKLYLTIWVDITHLDSSNDQQSLYQKAKFQCIKLWFVMQTSYVLKHFLPTLTIVKQSNMDMFSQEMPYILNFSKLIFTRKRFQLYFFFAMLM